LLASGYQHERPMTARGTDGVFVLIKIPATFRGFVQPFSKKKLYRE